MKKKIILLLLAIITFGVFLFGNNNLDLGWHLKYGEIFWRTGILVKDNIFSQTLPNYQWPNHSWGYDLLIYPIFVKFGFIGLSVAGGLMGVGLIFLIKKLFKLKLIETLIVGGIGYLFWQSLWAHGFKAQIISLLGITYAVYLGEKIKKKKIIKNDWNLAALIFLVWANLHGQFMLGLGYLGLVFIGMIMEGFKSPGTLRGLSSFIKRMLLGGKLIAFLGLITLINPYGWKNHLDSFRYLNFPYLNLVSEWTAWSSNSWQFWVLVIYLGFLAFGFWKNRKLLKPSNLIALIFFGFMAIKRRRMGGIFYIVSIPILVEILRSNYKKYLKISLSDNLVIAGGLMVIIYIYSYVLPQRNVWLKSWKDYCSSSIEIRCSEGLVGYLNKNPVSGKVFNYYNWGGYLIYRVKNFQTYIDGRMNMWFEENYFPMERYDQIYFVKDKAEQYFMEESFEVAVIQSGIPLEKILVEKLSWETLYRDHYSVVLKKGEQKDEVEI
jgi:hypothetical protein